MALTTYHHGITATETSNITPIIKSVSMSTIALVSVSDDADDTAYPLDTPVLLTGITTTDVEKSGSDDQLLHQCLRTIKAIQNTNVVVLRLSEPVDVDTVDLLLSCQTSLGVTPKILIAPEIDTPAMTRKLVEIAKRRRAFVYASPRAEDGTLITVKEDIVAYRDTFAARELMLIEGGFGAPGNSNPSDGSGSGDGDGPPLFFCTPTNADINLYGSEPSPNIANGAHARYRINGGVWQVVEYYPIDLEAITANPEYKDYVKKLLVEPKLPVSLEVEPGESVTLNLPIIRYVGGEDLLLYSDVYDQIDATTPITSEKQILNAEINSRAYEFYCNSLNKVAGWGSNFGVEMVEGKETTLEFATSSGVGIDLVEAMFGGDVEILSCGRGRDAGGV
ncbi:hypothetical protein GCM10016272_02480 [Psychrobacter glaciei]|uniref:Phage tail protein n=1 Tax=Psychrobacter glaciei TaxID=619771 RepID=A0ABQ3GNS5_9GAMM|nr:hypothetical protein [Psychrobacter glaciei]GHD26029.1 hypothetical protein GCM10016272_02480 [Psychrobacter glaciei]